MVSIRKWLFDYPPILETYRKMDSFINNLDILWKEKYFLEESLKSTGAFEKAGAGRMFYEMGGGERFRGDVIHLCGEYLFMIRVFDNIIDGHITGNELDRTVSKEILDQLVEFLEFGIEKENIKRDLPHLTGLIGSFEIANEFRDNLYGKLPQDSIEEFLDDLKNLCAVWANDKEFHHLDGETSTERVGTYMLCSVMDLAGFEDFVRNPEIKEIAAVGGKMVQIMDDLMDGDKGADSEELKDMFEKNKNRLKRIMEGVDPTEKLYKPSKEFLHSLQIYPYLSKISDSELYRNIRNSVSILI